MLQRRRNYWLLLFLLAVGCAEDTPSPTFSSIESATGADDLTTVESVMATTLLPVQALTTSSTVKPQMEVTTNGVSFIEPTKVKKSTNAGEKQQKQNSTQKPSSARFKGGGGTIQLVVNTPATRYPPHYYHTTPYPHTRPPYHHYPPPYHYPPYPYPYPTQATTSRPNWPPYWPPYGGGGGFPGGGFPGYGYPGFGYPGYGYPWYHHHHHHWNNTVDDDGRSAGVDVISTQLEPQVSAAETKKQPAPSGFESLPFFSFFNFNRSKK